ncbi:MAG: restriction endonuclease subunit S [Veillonella sp.]|jgi:putative toxin-antitoxin system, toxin component|uniref:restriction endonuclease subunit S n=1 Tax=Veillonella sp. TaxID=1926307 RepID=UPI0029037A5E|nr:restriction endonuclease subunit S [Veillonella sp.]MDU2580572.1 restriction endonuclease subunit S [Veillonella sp.]MDU7212155.1 restriction endonuclease subunit S [Veillonella sp.]
MAEWVMKKLKDIADFNPRESLAKGTVAKKIGMDKLQPFCRDVLGYDLEQFSGGTKFRNGDTIMARITPCLENGKTAKVSILDDGEVGFGSTEYIVFRAKNGVDEDFIYYLVCSPLVRELAIKSMVGSSGRQRVQTDVVQNLEIMVPDYEKQRRISGLLKSLDDKIALNNAINNNLEQQAQAIFQSWFIDYEPFGGKMPEDWTLGILGDFVEIKRGGSPRPIQEYLAEDGFRWLKISDATGITSPYILDIKEHIKESGLKKTVFLNAGSLVLSNSATPGIPKILDVDSCIHDGWLYFPKSKLSNEYLYLYFKYIRKGLVALGNGSVFTNLKTDILKNYPTALPSEGVLADFESIIQPMFEQILTLTRENHSLNLLRDTLLPKLMSGELDVTDIDL